MPKIKATSTSETRDVPIKQTPVLLELVFTLQHRLKKKKNTSFHQFLQRMIKLHRSTKSKARNLSIDKISSMFLAVFAEFKSSNERSVTRTRAFLCSSKTQTTSKVLGILERKISNKCKPFQHQTLVELN